MFSNTTRLIINILQAIRKEDYQQISHIILKTDNKRPQILNFVYCQLGEILTDHEATASAKDWAANALSNFLLDANNYQPLGADKVRIQLGNFSLIKGPPLLQKRPCCEIAQTS